MSSQEESIEDPDVQFFVGCNECKCPAICDCWNDPDFDWKNCIMRKLGGFVNAPRDEQRIWWNATRDKNFRKTFDEEFPEG